MIKAQDGTKLPTAPKAEIRYQNGVKDSVAYLGVPFKDSSYFGESIKRVKTPGNASIERRILFRHYPYDNDTTYTEIPEHSKYKMYPIKTKVQPRQATNSDVKYVKRNKDGFISYIPTTPSDEYATLKRRFDTAWGVAKHEGGGPVEKSDNTRVASGRPQQVLNKIPYGAGKGPAGEGPMRLFNDPYINMGLMAMAPMAVKIQSKNILAPAQRMESLPVSINQNYGLLRLYRTAQQKGYKGTIEDFIALSSEILGTPQATGPEGNKFLGYNLERGNNVLYSRPNPENPKVDGLTVNEPARWQELLKKIIK